MKDVRIKFKVAHPTTGEAMEINAVVESIAVQDAHGEVIVAAGNRIAAPTPGGIALYGLNPDGTIDYDTITEYARTPMITVMRRTRLL